MKSKSKKNQPGKELRIRQQEKQEHKNDRMGSDFKRINTDELPFQDEPWSGV